MQGLDVGIPLLGSMLALYPSAFSDPVAATTTKTWSGGGADNNWSTIANWTGGVAPTTGDAIVFAGTTRLAPVNDLAADTSIASLTFNAGAGAFSISGARITLTGNITNSSSNAQIINIAVILNVATCTITTTSAQITMGGVISEASGPRNLTKDGANLLLVGTNNTYTGTTTLTAGTLQNVPLNNTTYGTGPIVLNGGILWVDRLVLANNITNNGAQITMSNGFGASISGTITNNALLTVSCVNNCSAVFSGVISGAGGITVSSTGAALLTLSNTNTYTGTTIVTLGKLGVSGSLAAASTVTANGGTVQDIGTVGPTTVANSSTSKIRGGTGTTGNLTTTTLTFSGTSSRLEVNTNGTSTISTVTATTVVLGGVTVDFNTAQNLTAGTYIVITGTSMSGSATQGTLPIGRTWTSLTTVGNNLVAVLA